MSQYVLALVVVTVCTCSDLPTLIKQTWYCQIRSLQGWRRIELAQLVLHKVQVTVIVSKCCCYCKWTWLAHRDVKKLHHNIQWHLATLNGNKRWFWRWNFQLVHWMHSLWAKMTATEIAGSDIVGSILPIVCFSICITHFLGNTLGLLSLPLTWQCLRNMLCTYPCLPGFPHWYQSQPHTYIHQAGIYLVKKDKFLVVLLVQ